MPTLDTPLPEGKSAIWCGSFQLAWNELRTSVVQEPIEFVEDEPAIERLNKAAFSQDDLAPEMSYAAVGLAADGIAERIRLLSEDVLWVGESSLYPALQRLLLNGWVTAEWGASENNRRARFYTITAEGRKRLTSERKEFQRIVGAIQQVLETA